MSQFFEDLQQRTFARASQASRLAMPAASRLSGEQIQQFLEERGLAAIATTRADGSPHLTMSYFVLDQDELWLPSLPDTLRTRNLERSARVSLLVTEGDGPDHAMVKIEGEARLEDEAPPEVHLAHLYKIKSGLDWVDRWIRVTPVRLFSYRAAASRFAPQD